MGDTNTTGTEFNDFLWGGTEDDTIDGGAEFDIVTYQFAGGSAGVTVDLSITGSQNVGADQGADTIIDVEGVTGTTFADVLKGNALENVLDGGAGNDVLQGGGGNDILVGGTGADTFKFWFSTTQGEGQTDSFKGWLASENLATSGWTQDFFATKYKAYLEHLVDTYGIGHDLNGDGKIMVGFKQNDADGLPRIEGLSAEDAASMFGPATGVMVKTGKTTQERFYSETFSIADGGDETAASDDGHDIIADFDITQDTLDFSGLESMDQVKFETAFSASQADLNGDGSMDQTVLALEGDSTWSVTLVGVVASEGDLYGAIHFT